jgi:hypothetical protein
MAPETGVPSRLLVYTLPSTWENLPRKILDPTATKKAPVYPATIPAKVVSNKTVSPVATSFSPPLRV